MFADPSQKNPRQVAGLWLDEKMPDATVSLRVGTKATCNLLDLYDHAEPVAVNAGGTVSVPIKRNPSYLLVTNGEAVTTVRD